MAVRRFPWQLHLLLGILSLGAAVAFLVRGAVVDWTAERVVSAVVFAAFGALWLVAARQGRLS